MKIAAGEVIEGPFSVVRELIDNAVDAGSTQVRISITNGGKDFIQVTDNGTGMSEEDAKLSMLKHTTSKIKTIEDLNSIVSMGFRGEALASICAVSDFSLVTKQEEGEHGIRVYCEAGGDIRTEPAASNPGSVVTVRNLFRNLPARKKFLKSNRAEAAKVKDEIIKKAISFNGCGFTYKSDDKTVFSLESRTDRLGRLIDLYGRSFGENLIEVHHEDSRVTLHGYISNNKMSLPNRSGQYLFINGRPVSDRSLLFALNNPCRGVVQAGRYLYAFVFISIDQELVDINVHPAKKEIKIKPADQVYSAVYHAVDEALREGYYGIAFGPGTLTHAGPGGELSPLRTPEISGDTYTPAGFRTFGYDEKKWNGTAVHESRGAQGTEPGGRTEVVSARRETAPISGGTPVDSMESLFDIVEGAYQYRGSIFNTFLIFETDRGIILVDQHAAHERIFYEQYRRVYDGEGALKTLLVPINFTPPAGKYGDILDAVESFREAGIQIEPFGDESFNILTLPAFIPENREEQAVSQLFEELYAGNLSLSAQEIRDVFLKLAACRSAVKEGDVLNREEAKALIGDLLEVEVPFVCPHGRPTMVRYSREYFDKLFRRR